MSQGLERAIEPDEEEHLLADAAWQGQHRTDEVRRPGDQQARQPDEQQQWEERTWVAREPIAESTDSAAARTSAE